jgi:hypothetical protein
MLWSIQNAIQSKDAQMNMDAKPYPGEKDLLVPVLLSAKEDRKLRDAARRLGTTPSRLICTLVEDGMASRKRQPRKE